MNERGCRVILFIFSSAMAVALLPQDLHAQVFGACCNEVSCVFMNDQAACEANGRTFFPGVGCDPNPCGVTGACCLTIGCFPDFQQSCEQNGGFWAGPNTMCSPTSCEMVACCLSDGTCMSLPLSFCAASGGVVLEGVDCDTSPNACGVGACCTAESLCTQFNAHTCVSDGRTFIGAAIPCDPNPCAACGTCPGDLSDNGSVDGGDIQAFLDCYLEAAGGAPSTGCLCSDMDENGVVDENDLADLVNRLLEPDTAC